MKVTVEHGDERIVIEPGAMAGFAGVVVKETTEAERRYTLCVAYPADSPDVGTAADGFRDFATKETLEDAAWAFMRSPEVGLWHRDGTEGSGRVVESYIYRGPDWACTAADGSEQVIKAGDWLTGIIWAEDTFPMVKDGRIGGVSMQGSARRRRPTAQSRAGLRSQE